MAQIYLEMGDRAGRQEGRQTQGRTEAGEKMQAALPPTSFALRNVMIHG